MVSESLELLNRLVILRSVVHQLDPASVLVKELVQAGFIEHIPSMSAEDRDKHPYKLTQRGVDAANKYAEGQKATIDKEETHEPDTNDQSSTPPQTTTSTDHGDQLAGPSDNDQRISAGPA